MEEIYLIWISFFFLFLSLSISELDIFLIHFIILYLIFSLKTEVWLISFLMRFKTSETYFFRKLILIGNLSFLLIFMKKTIFLFNPTYFYLEIVLHLELLIKILDNFSKSFFYFFHYYLFQINKNNFKIYLIN